MKSASFRHIFISMEYVIDCFLEDGPFHRKKRYCDVAEDPAAVLSEYMDHHNNRARSREQDFEEARRRAWEDRAAIRTGPVIK